MLFLKYTLLVAGIAMFLVAAAIVAIDLWAALEYRRRSAKGEPGVEPQPLRWRTTIALVCLAWAPILIGMSIVVVPSGTAGVRVSQTRGTMPGTLYPGVHAVTPLVEHVEVFDMRDELFTTGSKESNPKPDTDKTLTTKAEALQVQSKEGLSIGLAITVRYRLDPHRLDYIQSHLPQPVETELVPPIVASSWRELAPSYTVREIFSSKREEVRERAAESISRQLGADGIVVKEVMLRDIQLPPEYAKGLESLLLKEQQNDQLGVETEIHAKQVRISEFDAEAQKVAQVKEAEGQAEVKVLEAKGESDAMQYTLPLKQKQIEQTRLEAEARKEATVKNAEAQADAKVIDGKAEMERRKYLSDAEANRIRVTAAADSERMKLEAAALKQNPLLINKIVAEKLSDKIQLVMVPTDSKFFFANDVFKGMNPANPVVREQIDPQNNEDDPPANNQAQAR
ncbi:MAG TPA: SPFH domain-containing protein [Terriglobales bacterium]|nr:SPFH domain-containing protein [Terriglobales bacterium]